MATSATSGDTRWATVSPRSKLRIYAMALALVGLVALPLDLPISQWSMSNDNYGDLSRGLDLLEVYGHGAGVGIIIVAAWLLDPVRRRECWRLAAASFGSGIAANVGKMILARSRPHHFDFTGHVWSSFGPWLPLWHLESGSQGFPSAHVATATGLSVALSAAYPRGRRLFIFLALGVAAQRIFAGAHFPSDTFWGAAVGCVFASFVVAARAEETGRELPG